MRPAKTLISIFIMAVIFLCSTIVFAQEPCKGKKCDCYQKKTCCASQTTKSNSVSSGHKCCVKSSSSVGKCCATMAEDKTSEKDLGNDATSKLTDMKMK